MIRVGRSSRNAIQLSDATISKEHAEIVRAGDGYLIRDLGSRNGTRVNGAEAGEPLPIHPGDDVEIGHVRLKVTDEQPSRPVRFGEATMVGSSHRIELGKVLERRARSRDGAGSLVHLLAEAGQLLVKPRPQRETFDEILQFVERALPASRHVLLLQETPDSEPVQITRNPAGRGADRPLALSRSIVKTVLDERASVLTTDASVDPRFAGHQSIVAQAVHSAMAVPLFDNQRVLGLIYVDSQDPRTCFDQDQLEVLTLLANMAAVRITNARLLEAEQARARLAQEAATAAQIQRGLLPSVLPAVPGYEVDAYLETCYEVGGDLYDVRRAPDGRVLFVVGDVSGKGMGAALLMSSFLSAVRVLYESFEDPGSFSVRLGRIIHENTDPARFVTAVVGSLDPASGIIRYVNAGHPAPYVVRGGDLKPMEATGVPFGVLPSFPYSSAEARLEPGDTLVLFSDGIPEAQRGEELFDDERLREAILEASREPGLPEVRTTILKRVDDFLAGEHRNDDVTLLLMRRSVAGSPAEKRARTEET